MLSFVFSLVSGNTTVKGLVEFFVNPNLYDHVFALALTVITAIIGYFSISPLTEKFTLKPVIKFISRVAFSCLLLFPLMAYLARLFTIT